MADALVRLKFDSKEYDSKIERARKGLLDFEESLQKAGKSFKDADAEQVKFVQQLGNFQTVARTAKGQVAELTKAYTDLKLQYDKLSEADKSSDFGKGMAASLNQLKTRIHDSKTELDSISKELNGNTGLNSALDALTSKLGITGNLTEMLTSKTALMAGAIGASVTAVTAATKAWADYNAELAKQDQQTTVITGLKGDDANRMTDGVRALASTYNVDFRQAVEAANTLMSQFGESGDSALQLLRDGMQGMIQGDGPKLLQMIQQYAPAFHDAGVSASQLVAVIQNSEGGIFTDQNMSAIVMGIKNIRLMTKQTSEALAKMGIDGEEMSKKMSEGSMTVFDALKQVAEKLKDVDSGSKTAGEVMQTVFGRQGAMAGTNLAKAIESLNTNLDETKTQTGDVGKSLADLQSATERLNTAIRNCFEYDGWDQMANSIKSQLITAIAVVIEKLGDVKKFFTEAEIAGVNLFENVRTSALNALGPLGRMLDLWLKINQAKNDYNGIASGASHGAALSGALLGNGSSGSSDDSGGDGGSGGGGGGGNASQKIENVKDSVADLTQQMKELQEAQQQVTDNEGWAQYQSQIDALSSKIDDIKGKVQEIDIDALFPQLDVSDQQRGTPKTPLQEAQDAIRVQISDQNVQVDENTFTNLLQVAVQNGIDSLDADFSSFQEMLGEGLNIPDESWEAFVEKLNEQLSDLGIDPIKLDVTTGNIKAITNDTKEMTNAWKSAASAVSSVGGAMKQIDDPAAKIAGIVAEAIASIALGYANASSQASEMGPWVWLAFAAAGLATTITTIAQIKQATSGNYAEGGIVPGSSFSGDNVRAYGLNSGELILNRAQQGSIAEQLTAGEAAAGGDPIVRVSGEDLIIVMNTALRRRGYGNLAIGDFN